MTFLSATTFLHAQAITGNVFRDFNANGTKDNSATFNEVGVGGVTVTCTDSAGGTGTTTTSTTAATLGNYSLTGCTGATRVEFVWTSTALYSGANGSGSNTSIQFINATRSNINFGINNPAHYSQANPPLVTPKYLNGDPFNDLGGNIANEDALYLFPYTATGDRQAGGTAATTLATQVQIGSTWGVAYSRRHKKLFMASAYKRHAPLGPGETGGRIYVINDPKGTPSTPSKFIDLVSDMSINVGAVETNSARGLATNKFLPSLDANAFSKVGKVSLGDLDISEDDRFLFVTNLHDRKIYKIDIDQVIAGTNNATALPDFTNPSCTSGTARPWGLGMWDGELYAGIVCTSESGGTTDDLRLIVQKFNFTSNTWSTVLTQTPNWDKGDIIFGGALHKWQKWEDSWSSYITPNWPAHPQPILGDIEFDEEGSMHLAVLDRLGFQTGHRNLRVPDDSGLYTGVTGGELLRTYKNPSTGVFALENNAVAGPYTSGGTGNNSQTGQGGPNTLQGPGGGEFYADDNTGNSHSETTNGGLVQMKGTRILPSVQMDPIDGQVDASGVVWFNINTGLETQEYQLFYNAGSPSPDFSKQNGLGDLEALSDPAPLEIGNRVWLDTDNDGVQDASEAGLDGITVTLTCGANTATTTTATVNGQVGTYYFKDGQAGLPAAWSSQIPRNTACKLSVAKDQTVAAVTYMATSANVGGAPGDTIDSDGTVSGANAEVMLTTGYSGQNNHTYDFGFSSTPPPMCTTITNNTSVEMVNETELSTTNNTSNHVVQVNCTVTYDWGDNPDTGAGSGAGNYLTSTTDNGPRHIIVTGLKLGATVDAETDGQPTGTLSTGDDTTGATDDEDGVTLPTFVEATAATLNFTLMNMTGTAAKLCGWIDFNKNGVYDNTTERQCTNVANAATTATLSFTAPVGSAGTTYARFRLSTDAAFITAMESTGEATSGEVEDYQVTITAGCSINTPTVATTCNDNGTPAITTDDTFTFTISATGTAAGASYKVDKTAPAPTATVFPTVNYGTTSAASSAFPISGGNLTLTLTDNTTATCTLTNVNVPAPAPCSTPPTGQPDLELTKTVDKVSVVSGNTLTYTLTLRNTGTAAATSVQVRDLLPAGLTYVSSVPSQGTYTVGTGIWNVGTVAQGATLTLTITVTVN